MRFQRLLTPPQFTKLELELKGNHQKWGDVFPLTKQVVCFHPDIVIINISFAVGAGIFSDLCRIGDSSDTLVHTSTSIPSPTKPSKSTHISPKELSNALQITLHSAFCIFA